LSVDGFEQFDELLLSLPLLKLADDLSRAGKE